MNTNVNKSRESSRRVASNQGARTGGWKIKTQYRWLAGAVELLSSMRFAISLLSLIAIASIIGTVVKQGEPMVNYVNQFGPFWFEIFDKFGLHTMYSTWWFLAIMGFLVLSTSLCIIRNAPKMLKDMRSWRDHVRERSLRHFHHRAEWQAADAPAVLAQRLQERVKATGYLTKLVDKDDKEQAILLVAKRGLANKWGYIFAHSAIVIICIGGLLDSDLPIRWQQWWYGKTPFIGNGIIAQISAQHRLSAHNPSFRGNTLIPEGSSSATVIVPQRKGVLIQDLPFTLNLRKFVIEHYSTGMPKLFASEVVVTDRRSGKTFPATIKVNQPLIYDGIAVYQSSFEDGGSKLRLTAYPMQGVQTADLALKGEVGASTPLPPAFAAETTIEWMDFRAFNIENMAQHEQAAPVTEATSAKQAADPQSNRRFMLGVEKHLGSAAKSANTKTFKNIGPSVQYKLRDKNGQAREYNNYMQPVQIEGASVFLTGMRASPSEAFRYLRIPADDDDSVVEWMRLRAAMHDPALRLQAAQRYAQHALPDENKNASALRQQLRDAALKNLSIFTGDGKSAGYVAVANFLATLPAAEQEQAANVVMKMLHSSVWELWQAAREKAGLPPMPRDEKHLRFSALSVNALSDTFLYSAPVYLQLTGFDEVKASVFQISRSPGKKIVYLGCLLLVVGVFSMFYNRERRLWIWIKQDLHESKTHLLMAMSTQRKTLDFEKEFTELKSQLMQIK